MIKALAHIECNMGPCLRALELKEEEQGIYEVASVINWYQFSSSTGATKAPEGFSERNTYFYIYSLTGRLIHELSNIQIKKRFFLGLYLHFW